MKSYFSLNYYNNPSNFRKAFKLLFVTFFITNLVVFCISGSTPFAYLPMSLFFLELYLFMSLPELFIVIFPLFVFVVLPSIIVSLYAISKPMVKLRFIKSKSLIGFLDKAGIIYLFIDLIAVIVSMISGFRMIFNVSDSSSLLVYLFGKNSFNWYGDNWIPLISLLVDCIFIMSYIYVMYLEKKNVLQTSGEKSLKGI